MSAANSPQSANSAATPLRAMQPRAPVDYIHTGPGTVCGRYLRMFWHPVHQSSWLAAGRAKTIRIMGEEFTLYRGASGTVVMTQPLCPHRLTRLGTGFVEGESLRCMYHGWKFGSDGQCTERPAEEPGLECKIKLKTYPVQEYLGLIFAYMGDGEPPEFPRYPHIEGPGVHDWYCHLRPINWFAQIDNIVDPAHTPFTHRGAGFLENGVVGVPKVEGHENDWGIIQFGRRPNGEVRVNLMGMPNIFHNKFPPLSAGTGWQELIVWCVPIDDESHWNFRVMLSHVEGEAAEKFIQERDERNRYLDTLVPVWKVAAAIVAGEDTLDRHASRPDIVAIQDLVTQIGMGTLPDRSKERLGRSDALVVLVRRIYERELRALDQGQPLKQWRWTPSLVAQAGDVK